MRRVLFLIRISLLALPLGFLLLEFYSEPRRRIYKSEMPAWVLDKNSDQPLSLTEAKVMWEVVDKRLSELERAGRRHSPLDRLFESPVKANVVLISLTVAWSMNAISLLLDNRWKRKE